MVKFQQKTVAGHWKNTKHLQQLVIDQLLLIDITGAILQKLFFCRYVKGQKVIICKKN